MRYKLLGKSGLKVSEIALGTMTFGEDWGWGADYNESKKIFDHYASLGGNFIDTANLYTNGTSEKYCGDFIRSQREHFVLATKYTLNMDSKNPNASGNNVKNMKQAVEASLRRLDTDYIDLLWVHMWDYLTPPEEIMRGLDDLVSSGKIFYIGVSDTPAWRVAQMNTLADQYGWAKFIALQIEYSLIERTVERELIPMAKGFGMSVTPWAALGGGILSGKYKKEGNEIVGDSDTKRANVIRKTDRNIEIADVVVDIAKKRNVSPAQVALNWVRQQDSSMIPIIGARTENQIKDSLVALDFKLDSNELKKLDEISNIDLGFPSEFLERDYVKNLLYGDFADKIDR